MLSHFFNGPWNLGNLLPIKMIQTFEKKPESKLTHPWERGIKIVLD